MQSNTVIIPQIYSYMKSNIPIDNLYKQNYMSYRLNTNQPYNLD